MTYFGGLKIGHVRKHKQLIEARKITSGLN